jgi:acyl-CoA synthetase (AMP-forming)/AMP-acid ligase II
VLGRAGSRFVPLAIGHQTVAEILMGRAAATPEAIAYTFLGRDAAEASITYARLDRQARAIGAELRSRGLEGERAVLMCESGLAFVAAFFGCLYAGVIAVPICPPRRNRGLSRIRSVVGDCNAAIVLADHASEERSVALANDAPELADVPWFAVDDLAEHPDTNWRPSPFGPERIALLQYTSGSTAKPKGVVLTHLNILHNQQRIRDAFEHDERSVVVGWLPLFHDMGLIGNLLQPMYVGCRCLLMSPTHFLQRPIRWLRAISRYAATTSGGPNFAYDLCVDATTPEEREGLDLSSWTLAFNGAERVRPATLQRFAKTFEPFGFRANAFYPCYGLAEATLIVTAGRKSDPVVMLDRPVLEPARGETGAAEGTGSFVGCGVALPGHDVRIVDPDTFVPLSDGRVGEIWIAGGNVAAGYWNKPEATRLSFGATLTGDRDDGRFFRTGDLGFVVDGELFVVSRLKDLIIVRGRNFYPEDLEATVVASHPLLRHHSCAVVPIEHEGVEQVGVIVEVANRRAVDFDEFAWAINRQMVLEHEIEPHHVSFIRQNTLPRTSSGKVQRHLCRLGLERGILDTVAERGIASSDRIIGAR